MGTPERLRLVGFEATAPNSRLYILLSANDGFRAPDKLSYRVPRQPQDNCFASSRIVDLNQTCAASVCILGRQVIRIFTEPSAEGALRNSALS
jgi:hypothetical protein